MRSHGGRGKNGVVALSFPPLFCCHIVEGKGQSNSAKRVEGLI